MSTRPPPSAEYVRNLAGRSTCMTEQQHQIEQHRDHSRRIRNLKDEVEELQGYVRNLPPTWSPIRWAVQIKLKQEALALEYPKWEAYWLASRAAHLQYLQHEAVPVVVEAAIVAAPEQPTVFVEAELNVVEYRSVQVPQVVAAVPAAAPVAAPAAAPVAAPAQEMPETPEKRPRDAAVILDSRAKKKAKKKVTFLVEKVGVETEEEQVIPKENVLRRSTRSRT